MSAFPPNMKTGRGMPPSKLGSQNAGSRAISDAQKNNESVMKKGDARAMKDKKSPGVSKPKPMGAPMPNLKSKKPKNGV